MIVPTVAPVPSRLATRSAATTLAPLDVPATRDVHLGIVTPQRVRRAVDRMRRAHGLHEGVHSPPGLLPHLLPQRVIARLRVADGLKDLLGDVHGRSDRSLPERLGSCKASRVALSARGVERGNADDPTERDRTAN